VTTTRSRPRLSDDELRGLLALVEGCDSVELSTKCLPGEAFQTAAETRVFLSGRGIDLDGKQETKTRSALAYFSKTLQGTSS
jgi:hypothetical protein